MTEPLRLGKLLLTFNGCERRPDPGGDGADELILDVTLENPERPLGEAGRAPQVEVHDAAGSIFEPVNEPDAWYLPMRPDTVASARLAFRVPEEATGLEAVFAPGTVEEAHVPLET